MGVRMLSGGMRVIGPVAKILTRLISHRGGWRARDRN
jgi:hypothetical protein